MSRPQRSSSCDFDSWADRLKRSLRPPCVVVAMGNRLAGDDAAGPEIFDRLKKQCQFPVLDGGQAPENLLGPLIRLRPETVLLIDAVHFGASPGRVRLFEPQELAEVDISTHAMSPKLLLQQIRSRTGAAVFLLGIQPQQREFGQPLSPQCRQAVESVSRRLIELSFPSAPDDKP